MNKYYLLLLILTCLSCGYKIIKNEHGEPIVDEKQYTFNKSLTLENLKVIDTAAVYVQIFDPINSNEQERENPKVYTFHNNGYFQMGSIKFYGKFDNHRPKNSVYYGGKFYVEGNEFFIEAFYPVSDGNTNRYTKVISKGTIKKDTIRMTIFNNKTMYVKRNLYDVMK